MTNKDFYRYCKENRKTETDLDRRTALTDLYQYMWECGTSKRGVDQLVATRVDQATRDGKPTLAATYTWLLGIFQGQASLQENGGDGSATLWEE